MPKSFKDTVKEDLDNILFNVNEFADFITINDKIYKAIYVSKAKTEQEYTTTEPYFLVKADDAKKIEAGSELLFNNTNCYITEIEPIDTYTAKLYISVNNRTNYIN